MKKLSTPKTGFSIFELVIGLLLLLILTFTVGERWIDGKTDIYVERDIIKSHLRYARFMALSNDHYDFKVTFSAGSYKLSKVSKSDGTETQVLLPNEGADERALPAGISFGPTVVTFDKWGSPGVVDAVIVITGDLSSETVTIKKNTGFIP